MPTQVSEAKKDELTVDLAKVAPITRIVAGILTAYNLSNLEIGVVFAGILALSGWEAGRCGMTPGADPQKEVVQ